MVGKKRLNKSNISNKLAYTLIVVALIVGLGIGVLALTPGVAPNPGHTIDTVAPPSSCTAGQVLTWSGSAWSCTTPSSGLTKGTNIIYKCPVSPIATNYCASVQLTRNGLGPCIGQLVTGGATGCFTVDANCAFTGFGTCTAIGYLVN